MNFARMFINIQFIVQIMTVNFPVIQCISSSDWAMISFSYQSVRLPIRILFRAVTFFVFQDVSYVPKSTCTFLMFQILQVSAKLPIFEKQSADTEKRTQSDENV